VGKVKTRTLKGALRSSGQAGCGTQEIRDQPKSTGRSAGATVRNRCPWHLVGEAHADFVGYFEGLLYAGADAGAVEVVGGEVQAGEAQAESFYGG
jgi:hypothetical protein